MYFDAWFLWLAFGLMFCSNQTAGGAWLFWMLYGIAWTLDFMLGWL